jgi:dnd system-associated protein 4
MPNSFARSSGRVSIDANIHDFYKQLTTGKNPEDSPFLTMKDLFMLAACVGFQMQQSKPLGKREQPFHYSVFTEAEDIPILKAIAIATTGDVEILADPDQIVSIAEEYANVGIHEIRTSLTSDIGQPLWNLVEAIRSSTRQTPE